MSTSDTPIFYKHWTTIYVKEFPTLQNIMFNIYSNEQPLPFTCKTKHNRPYYISKEDADKMAESIKEEERCLTKKYKSSRMEQEVAEIPMITLDDDMETIHCIEEVDLEQPIHHEQPKKSYKERNEPQCVQIPTINIETLSAISKDQDKESVLTGDESMLNYKINRQRYHAFCQNQAIKEEQAKKQKKQRRISRKVEGLQAQRKHTKGKTWKAQATSIKKILTASKNTEKPPKDPILIMTMIQKETIPTMYQLSPAQANSVDYSPSANEDTFFSSVFEIIKADMQYARIYKLRQSNLSKIRTFIVRRILDDFVAQRHQDSPEQRQHLARHNRRITRFDRNRYLQAGISEPPSRMKSQYLQQIFQNQSFCEYYIKYLTSQRLKKYMQESNEEITERYWKDILAISNRDKLTLSQKVTLFKEIKRKPLFRSQIAEYLEEGNMIRIEYCKDKEHGYPQ